MSYFALMSARLQKAFRRPWTISPFSLYCDAKRFVACRLAPFCGREPARKLAVSLSLLSVLWAVGCSVDRSGLIFDDVEFEKVSGAAGASGEDVPELDCKSGELSCDGQQVLACVGGEEVAVGAPCEFACVEGECSGVCETGATECLSDIEVQECDDAGQWSSSFCQYVCVDGDCGGSCRPGMSRCGGTGGLTVETCNLMGEWEATNTVCTGSCSMGKCTGTCVNGDTQCVTTENGEPAEVTCEGGTWENSSPQPCDYTCVDGACSGVCSPGSKRCASGSNGEPLSQTCDSEGQWITPGVECDFICQDGECAGECSPGAQKCEGSRVLRCNANAQWETATDCSEENLICVAIGDERRCGQCSPPKGTTEPSSCYFTSVVYCSDDGMWEEYEECSSTERPGVCAGSGDCRSWEEACENEEDQGCLEPTKGWYCPELGGAPLVVECDCSDGIACHEASQARPGDPPGLER